MKNHSIFICVFIVISIFFILYMIANAQEDNNFSNLIYCYCDGYEIFFMNLDKDYKLKLNKQIYRKKFTSSVKFSNSRNGDIIVALGTEKYKCDQLELYNNQGKLIKNIFKKNAHDIHDYSYDGTYLAIEEAWVISIIKNQQVMKKIPSMSYSPSVKGKYLYYLTGNGLSGKNTLKRYNVETDKDEILDMGIQLIEGFKVIESDNLLIADFKSSIYQATEQGGKWFIKQLTGDDYFRGEAFAINKNIIFSLIPLGVYENIAKPCPPFIYTFDDSKTVYCQNKEEIYKNLEGYSENKMRIDLY